MANLSCSAILVVRKHHQLPVAGPGHRTLLWTWVKNPWDGKWLQSEAARSGKPNKFEVQYEYMIILFHLPEINMTFANANHVTPAEKNMVFRAHVNLGHPAVKEFVRLLKAAGTRNDIIEYDASKSDLNQPDCQLQKQGSTISVW